MVERLAVAVEDAEAIARHVRGYVPAPAAVHEVVAGILASVEEGGDDALLMHERRFGGGEEPLRVPDDELRAALDALDPAVRDGLETARANVRAVAEAGLGADAEVTLPAGPARAGARAAGAPRGGLCARRAAPVSVLGRDGRGDGPRGRRGGTRGRRAGAPGDPRRVRALRRRRGLPHGRRAGDRRARLRHRDDPAGRRDRRPRQPLRAGGQAPALRPGRDRRVRRPVRPARARLRRGGSAPDRAGPARAGRARHGLARRRGLGRPRAARRGRARGAARCSPGARRCPAARRCSSTRRGLEGALAFAEALAPEHLELVGEAAEALAPRVTRAGCLFVGRRERHRVRRLRRGFEPHAADRRRGALRVRAWASATSAAAWPRCASATPPRRSRAPASRSPRPRASPCTPSRCPPGSARIPEP